MSKVKKLVCNFCKTSKIDELNLGKIYMHKKISTHYHCLLLSSNTIVTGDDDDGIMGFMPEVIENELKRGRQFKCCYCKKNTATIGCVETKCPKVFHLPCGLKAGIISQFYDEFPSYCEKHAPKQDSVLSLENQSNCEEKNCDICLDPIQNPTSTNTLWASCCQNGWFHRTCMQKLAKSAGQFFFKCPLCNNIKEFAIEMKRMGIYVPEQDASWEREPHAFQDLLYRYDKCDADKCLCTNGRKYNKPDTIWKIVLCELCGSSGIHTGCKRLPREAVSMQCTTCSSGLNRSTSIVKGKRKSILPEEELQEQYNKAKRKEHLPSKTRGRTKMFQPKHKIQKKTETKSTEKKMKSYSLRPRN